jgi:ABC-type antimicrobial peptide transport system permease subunit
MFLSYTLRNLVARRATVLPTMLAIITTVAAITVMQAMVVGLLGTLGDSGSPTNAVVLSFGAEADAQSGIGMPMVQKVSVLPEVGKDNGADLLSPEFLITYKFKVSDGHVRTINVRGVDPIALRVHRGLSIVQGDLPANHALGCVVGSKLVGKLEGFTAGGKIHIGHQDWPVTGILNAPSTQFESELWCDRTALMNEARRPTISVMYVTLTGADAQESFAKGVRAIAEQPLDAFSERVHFQRSSGSVEIYVKAVTIISLVLAIGAILACINAVYLAFLGRIRELATLAAIGYTRRRIAWIALQESLLMTLLSGAAGLGLALLADGHSFSMEEINLVYSARVSTDVLVVGGVVAVAIGVLGALASVVHSLRLNVLTSLRAL